MTWVQDQLDDETLFPSKIGEYYWLSRVLLLGIYKPLIDDNVWR